MRITTPELDVASRALRRMRWAGLALFTVVFSATYAYHWQGRSWLDSFYMVVITISSVGFGEKSELNQVEQWITIAVILIGISSAVISLGAFFQMVTEGEIDRVLNHGRNSRSVDRMHGHVIICGYGRMGRMLARELQSHRAPLVIVDQSGDKITEAQVDGHSGWLGDAAEETTLTAAGIDRAVCLVTCLPSDASNVFITLTSRNLNAKLQIIARGESLSTEKKLLQAGASRVIMPAAIGARRIASMITRPSTTELLELMSDSNVLDVEIDEIVIPENHSLVGRTIRETEARRQHGMLVVAVKSAPGSMLFNPAAETILSAGDTLIVMAKSDDIERFRKDHELHRIQPGTHPKPV